MLDVDKITLVGKHAVLVTKRREVFCWGEGKSGQGGHNVNCPKEVETLDSVHVKFVSCSEYQTCALAVSSEVYTWGDNCSGQSSRWVPHRISGVLDGITISKVSCREWYTVIVSDSGQGMRVKSITCGTWHTAVVVGILKSSTPTGKLFTWGDGDKGRLGHTSGSYHVVVLTSKGSVYTWGKGANGQLGVDDTEDRNSPTLVETLSHRQVESFGFMKKKHSCYNCGLLFCSICSDNKSRNACLAPDETKSFRVYDSCYKKLERSSSSTGDKNCGISGASSLLMNRVPRWGQVSSHASFRKHGIEESSSNNPSKQKACQQSVKPTIKRKGAKDAIKALTSKLQSMSPGAFMQKQAKAHVDTPTCARQLMYSSTHRTCDIEARDINNSGNAH
ncbi:PH, RCC1 and FYVE domains-containing protein 1 [Tanacetum coccineum]